MRYGLLFTPLKSPVMGESRGGLPLWWSVQRGKASLVPRESGPRRAGGPRESGPRGNGSHRGVFLFHCCNEFPENPTYDSKHT